MGYPEVNRCRSRVCNSPMPCDEFGPNATSESIGGRRGADLNESVSPYEVRNVNSIINELENITTLVEKNLITPQLNVTNDLHRGCLEADSLLDKVEENIKLFLHLSDKWNAGILKMLKAYVSKDRVLRSQSLESSCEQDSLETGAQVLQPHPAILEMLEVGREMWNEILNVITQSVYSVKDMMGFNDSLCKGLEEENGCMQPSDYSVCEELSGPNDDMKGVINKVTRTKQIVNSFKQIGSNDDRAFGLNASLPDTYKGFDKQAIPLQPRAAQICTRQYAAYCDEGNVTPQTMSLKGCTRAAQPSTPPNRLSQPIAPQSCTQQPIAPHRGTSKNCAPRPRSPKSCTQQPVSRTPPFSQICKAFSRAPQPSTPQHCIPQPNEFQNCAQHPNAPHQRTAQNCAVQPSGGQHNSQQPAATFHGEGNITPQPRSPKSCTQQPQSRTPPFSHICKAFSRAPQPSTPQHCIPQPNESQNCVQHPIVPHPRTAQNCGVQPSDGQHNSQQPAASHGERNLMQQERIPKGCTQQLQSRTPTLPQICNEVSLAPQPSTPQKFPPQSNAFQSCGQDPISPKKGASQHCDPQPNRLIAPQKGSLQPNPFEECPSSRSTTPKSCIRQPPNKQINDIHKGPPRDAAQHFVTNLRHCRTPVLVKSLPDDCLTATAQKESERVRPIVGYIRRCRTPGPVKDALGCLQATASSQKEPERCLQNIERICRSRNPVQPLDLVQRFKDMQQSAKNQMNSITSQRELMDKCQNAVKGLSNAA